MKLSALSHIAFGGPESVKRACRDLALDFERVGQKSPEVGNGGLFEAGTVTVGDLCEPSFRQAWEKEDLPRPAGEEQYVLCIQSDRVLIAGSDERGTIFGVYALSQALGVPAGIRFMNVTLPEKETLEEGVMNSKKPDFRFRGWFINDEDLLTGWHEGEKRTLDYDFYQTVVTVETMDLITETALRMNMNLIIPASFLDIDEPAQEALVAHCAARGLLVSQHHIEPLGVNHYMYENYFARRGKAGEAMSYAQDPDGAREIWRYYAQKWAKYKDHVIWQLGLRGKGDRPVWNNDDAVTGMEKWGKIISRAIKEEYDIVREACGSENFLSTATLWMEGTALYRGGYLTLPEKTTVIFADVGPTQMLSEDFYSVPREQGRTYGLYYHICYWGDGPHLAQGTAWEKIAYNYRLAKEKGDVEYTVLNVSNVRPFILSCAYHARLTRDTGYTPAIGYRELAEEYYGNGDAGNVMQAYFRALTEASTETLVKKYEPFFSFRHGTYEDFSYYTATDGVLKWIGRDLLDGTADGYWRQTLKDGIEKMKKVLEQAESLSCHPYFEEFRLQIRHLLHEEAWAYHCACYRESHDSRELEKAGEELKAILCERKALEMGQWENWFRDERKIGIPWLIKETENKRLTGERKDLII